MVPKTAKKGKIKAILAGGSLTRLHFCKYGRYLSEELLLGADRAVAVAGNHYCKTFRLVGLYT